MPEAHSAVAQVVTNQVQGYAREPGAEAGFAPELMTRAESLEKKILGERFRKVPVRDGGHDKAKNARTVQTHHFVKIRQLQHRLLLHQRRKLRGNTLSHVTEIDGVPLYEFTGYRKKRLRRRLRGGRSLPDGRTLFRRETTPVETKLLTCRPEPFAYRAAEALFQHLRYTLSFGRRLAMRPHLLRKLGGFISRFAKPNARAASTARCAGAAPEALLFDLRHRRVDVEGVGWELDVVGGPVEVALAYHVTVFEAGDAEGGGESVDGVIVVVFFAFGVFVVVDGVSVLEGPAAGEVGFGIHLDGHGVVLGVDERDLVGEVAFGEGLAVVDEDGFGVVHPDAEGGVDGVVAGAQVVFADVFREGAFALVGGFPAEVAGEDVDVVVLFAELDALLALGRAPFAEIGDGSGGLAVVEAGDAAFGIGVLEREPALASESGEHGLELGAGLLGVGVRRLRGGLGKGGAGRDQSGEEEREQGCCSFHPARTAPPLTLRISPLMNPA